MPPTLARDKGWQQLDGYLARLGQDSGWLVIFDRRENAPELEERLKTEIHTTPRGRSVTLFEGEILVYYVLIVDAILTILNCGRKCHILGFSLHEFNVRSRPSAGPAALMSN
ncbi:hypothetical protein [Microcoleus sp. K5-D4]|uniref:hypothetical protein n=1 Tax=Microcoleus sp. K5-D4 TaxID=2818801 RepID=UPI002FD42CCB